MFRSLRLSIKSRFLVIIGAGVLGLAAAAALAFTSFEIRQMEREAHETSVNELLSLRALIISAMARRLEDPESIGVGVFNAWFGRRNEDYPGTLWSAWSDQVWRHVQTAEPGRKRKQARDAVDEEALATGKTVARFVDGFYRVSMPINLGVTHGADQEACFACHQQGMGLRKGDVIAVLSSSLSIDHQKAALNEAIFRMALVTVIVTVLFLLGIRLVLTRTITGPIGSMTGTMSRLAEGELTVEVPHLGAEDELGEMAQAIAVFKENARHKEVLAEDQRREREAKERRARVIDLLITEFNAEVMAELQEITAFADTMKRSAQAMSSVAVETDTSVQQVNGGSLQASDNVQMVANATQSMSAAMDEIVTQVAQAAQASHDAVQVANRASGRVTGLSEAVSRINQVLKLINAIASRTKLLALNATIEAVRGGEAGRGFAVVATEVKNLALQTTQATEQISTQIQAIQSATGDTAEAISEISSVIDKIDHISTSIAAATEEQGAATREIFRAVQEAAAGTSQVSLGIASVCDGTRMTEKTAAEVLGAAMTLCQSSADLRERIDTFLTKVRTA